MSVQRHDVVVVGAGMAGLCAAHRLAQLGRDVVVLEAADSPGGRVGTEIWGHALIETGGMFLAPAYAGLLELAEELGLRDQIVPIDEGLALAIRAGSGWQYIDMGRPVSMLLSRDISARHKAGLAWGALRMARHLRFRGDWTDLAPLAAADDRSLRDAMGPGIDHLTALLELDTGYSASEASASCATLIPRLVAASVRAGGLDVLYVACGMGSFVDKLAAGQDVRYSTAVSNIQQSDDHAVVTAKDSRGRAMTFHANHVVLATTADVASTIWPDAPAPVIELLTSVRYTDGEGVYFSTDKVLQPRTPGGRMISQSIVRVKDRGPDGFMGIVYQNQYTTEGGLVAIGRPVGHDPDDVLVEKAARAVRELHPEFDGDFTGSTVLRRERYVPVIEPGHVRRIVAAQAHLPAGRIALAGDYLRFTVLEGALQSGYSAAQQVSA